MKEFVVGSPYTTETKITSSDSWLIVACDGVRPLTPSLSISLGGLRADVIEEGCFSCGTFVRMKKRLKFVKLAKTLRRLVRDYWIML